MKIHFKVTSRFPPAAFYLPTFPRFPQSPGRDRERGRLKRPSRTRTRTANTRTALCNCACRASYTVITIISYRDRLPLANARDERISRFSWLFLFLLFLLDSFRATVIMCYYIIRFIATIERSLPMIARANCMAMTNDGKLCSLIKQINKYIFLYLY